MLTPKKAQNLVSRNVLRKNIEIGTFISRMVQIFFLIDLQKDGLMDFQLKKSFLSLPIKFIFLRYCLDTEKL